MKTNFSELTLTQLVDRVAKMYIQKCTTDVLYDSGKINSVYFKLKRHFQNESKYTLEQMLDFLFTINRQTELPLSALYEGIRRAREKENEETWNKFSTVSHEEAVKRGTLKEEPYSLEEFLKL